MKKRTVVLIGLLVLLVILAALICYGPVSYTHLDVYKRQGQRLPLIASRGAACALRRLGEPPAATGRPPLPRGGCRRRRLGEKRGPILQLNYKPSRPLDVFPFMDYDESIITGRLRPVK